MGVDISMFATKCKIRLCADRAWVFRHWDADDDYYDELHEAVYRPDVGLDDTRALIFLDMCEKGHKRNHADEPDRLEYAIYWLDAARKIIKAHPDDIFFLMTDMEDEYYDLCKQYKKIDPVAESQKAKK
jgi:hypothetical protein